MTGGDLPLPGERYVVATFRDSGIRTVWRSLGGTRWEAVGGAYIGTASSGDLVDVRFYCAADGEHAGDSIDVIVAGIYGVPEGHPKPVPLCARHREELDELEALFERDDVTEIPVPRAAIETLLRRKWDLSDDVFPEVLAAYNRATTAPRPSSSSSAPPWHLTRAAVGYLETLVASKGPVAVSDLDQIRGTIRDELDKLEVSLHDETAVYHGLVWIGIVTELARNGLRNGEIVEEVYASVAQIVTTIAAALLEYLPPEARR